MKKQLLALTLLALGYVASSHGAGVALMAHMTKFNEKMSVGETQKINGVDAYLVDGQGNRIEDDSCIMIEPGKKEGTFVLTAVSETDEPIRLIIKKRIAGYHPSTKVHTAEHDLTITTKNAKKYRMKDMDGLMVDEIESTEPAEESGAVVIELEEDKDAE